MRTEKSEQLFEKAKTLFPGGVNSPVRAFGSVGGTPRFIAKGKGSKVWDVDGNKYIDFCASWGPFYFNGDDGVPLFNGDPNDPANLKDLIGRIGEDPGTAWSDSNGVWWTRDHTLYRKSDVLSGHQAYLEEFLVQTEWDSLSIDDFSGLGWHNCACPFGASPSFQPETASICDSFQFNSFTSEVIDFGPPIG